MTSIYRKELRSYFTTMTGVIVAAFLLFICGIYTVVYNFGGGYPNFEYSLSAICFVFLILVPILTMRSFAEERSSRTDQLLFSLPMSLRSIVIGKYLAMVTVIALPMLLMAFIPPILSIYGSVNFASAYATLFAFFLMGCALIAVGMFFSSLTESQIISAVITFGALLICFLAQGISSLIPTTSIASFICLTTFLVILAFILYNATKNGTVAGIAFIVLEAALLILYLVNSGVFEGLVPDIISRFAVFDSLSSFVGGRFDVTVIVYYLSIAVAFMFFTEKSMEHRRNA